MTSATTKILNEGEQVISCMFSVSHDADYTLYGCGGEMKVKQCLDYLVDQPYESL